MLILINSSSFCTLVRRKLNHDQIVAYEIYVNLLFRTRNLLGIPHSSLTHLLTLLIHLAVFCCWDRDGDVGHLARLEKFRELVHFDRVVGQQSDAAHSKLL